jgi:DNA-binding transcriptional LysR family regulator
MLELSLLRHFVAVAEAGSFTGAARDLQTSQPVITRSIQRLEDVVATRLVERTTRNLHLTPAGKALLLDARFLLGRANVAIENARRIGQGNHARLRIGICPTTESPELARGIADFRTIWPHVDLHLSSMGTAKLPAALRAGEVDAGIMQTDGLWPDGIVGRVVASYGLVVAVPAAWGYCDGQSVRLIDLKDRPWLMPERLKATVWHDSLMEMCRRAGFEPRIVGTVEDPLTARIMIASGIGATFFHDLGRRDWSGAIHLLHFADHQIPPPSQTAIAYAEGTSPVQITDLGGCIAGAIAALGYSRELPMTPAPNRARQRG